MIFEFFWGLWFKSQYLRFFCTLRVWVAVFAVLKNTKIYRYHTCTRSTCTHNTTVYPYLCHTLVASRWLRIYLLFSVDIGHGLRQLPQCIEEFVKEPDNMRNVFKNLTCIHHSRCWACCSLSPLCIYTFYFYFMSSWNCQCMVVYLIIRPLFFAYFLHCFLSGDKWWSSLLSSRWSSLPSSRWCGWFYFENSHTLIQSAYFFSTIYLNYPQGGQSDIQLVFCVCCPKCFWYIHPSLPGFVCLLNVVQQLFNYSTHSCYLQSMLFSRSLYILTNYSRL
jgi:hypothetical protein